MNHTNLRCIRPNAWAINGLAQTAVSAPSQLDAEVARRTREAASRPEDAHLTDICHTITACFAISIGTHGHLSNTMKRPNESTAKSICNINEDSQPRLRAYALTYHHIITSSTSSSGQMTVRLRPQSPACVSRTSREDKFLDAITTNHIAIQIPGGENTIKSLGDLTWHPTTSSFSFPSFYLITHLGLSRSLLTGRNHLLHSQFLFCLGGGTHMGSFS
jgi:hypothetical protein